MINNLAYSSLKKTILHIVVTVKKKKKKLTYIDRLDFFFLGRNRSDLYI